ncbi:MAG TPA: winged helix-turn-helix domain-containing protein [Acidobacteriota bacterium]|jgi:hypothetical protein|nr:winged helix-turn-helix domain-containing protein [Acidobacteriota bacterium]HNR38832.1 winged helix-turn-helix domain-containing protein [Acidobacteriota bacterium]HNT99471.1 winged helix-turn-helix domain-containing protein [Acidobacteriota bacterium]HPB28110.1 winged helix-turn-helix domain-containing protein [Acidobacteriota bacterium]HQO25146.1 winged helix-turn-helix domain-containing protein [Acidobacteriota bacterium]
MNYLEAAMKILEEAGRPLTSQQITMTALERDWIEPQGPEPSSIMNVLIMQDLKSRGVRSDFSRVSPGTYTLRKLVYKNAPETEDPPPPRAVPAHADRPRHAPRADKQRPEGHRSQSNRPASGNREMVNRPQRHHGGQSRPHPSMKRPEPARAAGGPNVDRKELWELMEALGTVMGYKVLPVRLADKTTNCMGWHIGGNPELAYILWVVEGTDMNQGIRELIGLNYHKVMIMADDDNLAAAQQFIEGHADCDKIGLVSLQVLRDQARAGTQYMEFYNTLCDCRPLGDRKTPLVS